MLVNQVEGCLRYASSKAFILNLAIKLKASCVYYRILQRPRPSKNAIENEQMR